MPLYSKGKKWKVAVGPYEIQKIKSQYYAKKPHKWIAQTSIYFKRKGTRNRALGESVLGSTAGNHGGQKTLYLEVDWKFLLG